MAKFFNPMTHPIVENIRKIINDKGINQKVMAKYAGTSASQFNKVLNGSVQLSLRQISNIAMNLGLREIDLYTYPDVYEKQGQSRFSDEVRASLTIELSKSKKDQVLKLVFGENNLEILNK